MNKQAPQKRQSLRCFLRNQLLLLTGCIVVGFAALMFYIYIDGLDIASRKGLLVIGSYYGQLHDEGSLDTTTIETDEFSIYVGQENLPAAVADRFPQKTFSQNELYKSRIEVTEEQQAGVARLVLMTAIPIEQGKRQLFAIYHFRHGKEHTTGGPPPIKKTVFILTFAVFLPLLLAVFWIARRFNRRVLEPMEALADMAQKVDETSPEISHKILHDRSEIGLVAHSLKQAMGRIHAFHQREKTFLQNVSHELRTPITVVGSALDIIERRLAMGKQDVTSPLTHIRQASTNMKETTEALLWLSREESLEVRRPDDSTPQSTNSLQSPIKTSDLRQILTEQVEQLEYLIEGREIDVTIAINTETLALSDPALIRILFANLIRNAFEHTFEGKVTIEVNDTDICIIDTGIGLSGDNNPIKRGESGRDSFGLGLDIVSRIADKKGWVFTLESHVAGGCTARLRWGRAG